MPKHVKPTPEELEAGIKKSQEELEELGNPPNPPKEPLIPSPSPSPSPEVPSPSKPIPPTEPPVEPKPDYKKKFSESSREALVIHAKNKKINEVITEATQLPDPTEEELQAEYPDWEIMSDFEKRLAKDSLKNSRRFSVLEKIGKETQDIETWNNKVDSFIDNPKILIDIPELEGKQEEFKIFATKPTRRGVDFEDLVKAFLYDINTTMKPKNKGKMFETGSGGPNEPLKPKSDKISIEEARVLRKTNYPKYKELLQAGKIDTTNV